MLTTPVIRALKKQLSGNVEIHFLTKKKFMHLLDGNPYISHMHGIEKTVQEVLPTLEKIGFDYIIDLHRNIRTAVVKRRLKSLSFTFRKLNIRKWIWVNLGINMMPALHVVDRYLETIRAFQVKDDGAGLDFFLPDLTSEQFNIPPEKYIAFVIGGMHEGKKMSRDKCLQFCRGINFPVVILGGKEDAETGKFLAEHAGQHVLNMAGIYSIQESALCLKNAELVVTGDTGLMHIAAAFQKKIISIWGCTVPGFGMSPYRAHPASIVLEPFGRKRRPCSKLGNHCKYGLQQRCTDQIDNKEIYGAIEKLWAL